MTTPATPINRTGVVVQRMVECQIVAKRLDAANQRWEYLARWTGQAGDLHEVWYPETLIKLED